MNKTDALDDQMYDHYNTLLSNGSRLDPQLHYDAVKDAYTYYSPIIMSGFCLNCHGSKEFIGGTYEYILSLYPDDLAIDYRSGDLRGLWRIDFN